MTNSLERRLVEHNNGLNKSTKAYIPWQHVHKEIYPDRPSARKREKYLKSYRGRTFIRNSILNQ